MNIFIDGQYGTTGLQLEQRLRNRRDVNLISIDPDLRKNEEERGKVIRQADVVFLCLPDDAARQAAVMASPETLVIDASTAHRTHPDWAYGLPEISAAHRARLASIKRIAVPGCHACGFISMIYPLIANKILDSSAQLHCTSLTGYSGGGLALINTHETDRIRGDKLQAPRPYAMGLTHKHLPEMKAITGLAAPPVFMPVVGDIAQGMLVTVPLWLSQCTKPVTRLQIHQTLTAYYEGSAFIRVMPLEWEDYADSGFIDPTACNGTNRMDIFVFGHDEQIILSARLDNLGKGASGAAVQCMNIACGLDEKLGLLEE